VSRRRTKDEGRRAGITNYELRITNYSFRPSSFVLRPLSIPLALFFLALALRLYCLDCHGLWYDEVASIEIAQRGPIAILTDRFGGMLVQTPLHYLLVWLTMQPVDPYLSTALVRLPSVLAGAITPVAVYALGREMFGRSQGLVAGLLLALSAIHVGQSQDVRPYTLLVLFTTLSVYCLVKAHRTRSGRWWAAFAASTIANLYISYFAMVLVMPALVPYILRVLYRLWSRKGEAVQTFRHALTSLGVIALAAAPVLLDMLQVHRTAPNWGRLPDILVRQLSISISRIQQFGIGGPLEDLVQWGLLLLAIAGVVAAIRKRQLEGMLVCISMVLVPALLLVVLRTSNQVFQRYAIFSLPFYFLLVSNGLVSLWPMRASMPPLFRRASGAIAGMAAIALLLPFLYSVYLYFTPEQHRRLSFLPDYRGVSRYLAEQARPQDLIVLLDEPALGMAVVNYYWRGVPPAVIYDARDPRLFDYKTGGAIFWVVSVFQNEPDFQEELASSRAEWDGAQSFERIVVLKENSPPDVISGMLRIVGAMEKRHPDFNPVLTLRGCIMQARGGIAMTAEYYHRAGEYYPRLGEEFLATARGFQARGDPRTAWREAMTSKFMYPGNPEVHRWLSDWLAQAGYPQHSRIEADLAKMLDAER